MKSYIWLMEHAPIRDITDTSGLPDNIAHKFLNEVYNKHTVDFKTVKREFKGDKMAYRRRFKKSYGRARSYGKRGYGKAKSMFNLSPAFLAGFLVGYTNMDDKIPAQYRIMAAVAPIKGFGMVKGFAQGMLLGNVVQGYTQGGATGTGSGFGI